MIHPVLRVQPLHSRAITMIALLISMGSSVISVGAESKQCPTTGVRVLLTSKGILTVDGVKVDPSKLKAYLERLKPRPTMICYALDAVPGGALPPERVAVLDAFLSVNLPFTVFLDANFTKPLPQPY